MWVTFCTLDFKDDYGRRLICINIHILLIFIFKSLFSDRYLIYFGDISLRNFKLRVYFGENRTSVFLLFSLYTASLGTQKYDIVCFTKFFTCLAEAAIVTLAWKVVFYTSIGGVVRRRA